MLALLDKTKFPSNNYRKIASNNGYCKTMTFGLTGLSGRTWESVKNIQHKELYEKLKLFATELDPNFKYTSITVNKNFQSFPHYDNNNEGMSMIIAVGNYTGGNLNVEGDSIDIHNAYYFDGSKQLHWTEPFQGTRYSIIYFTRDRAKN